MGVKPESVYYCLARFEVGYYGFGRDTVSHLATFNVDHVVLLSRGLVICSDVSNFQWESLCRDNRSVQRVCRPTKVLEWLKEAAELAPICTRSGRIDGMTLIDCKNGKIIKNTDPEKTPWVALSYSWSLADTQMVYFVAAESTDQHIRREEYLPDWIPKVVQQAMAVVCNLGLRYLWVDKYCIDQGNKIDKELQISQMDRIYALASLTIAAASTDGLLPGFPSGASLKCDHVWLQNHNLALLQLGPDGESLKHQTFWHSRGWTYQEDLLSQQVLYFTDTHTYLSSKGYTWSDILPTSDSKITIRRQNSAVGSMLGQLLDGNEGRGQQVGPAPKHPVIEHQGEIMSEYLKLIEYFSTRSLTFDSDALNAIKGISNIIERSEAGIGSIQGIPYIIDGTPSKEYGDAADYCHFTFVANLCWSHTRSTTISYWHYKHCSEVRRRPEFPSWSWAGWKGGVIRFLFDMFFIQASEHFTLQRRQNKFRLYVRVFGFLNQNMSPPVTSLTELSNSSDESRKRLRCILLNGTMLPESICDLDMRNGCGLFCDLVEVEFEKIRQRTMSLVLVMDFVVGTCASAFCWLIEWDDSEVRVIGSKTLRVAWRRKLVAARVDRVKSICGDLSLYPRTSFILK